VARAVVIANPAAARTDPAVVEAIRGVFRSAGWKAEILATGGPGDATRLAEYAVHEGVDVCAVFGGDGTTMQAASALVGTDVALGLIPGGTGNLLAGNLRLPANPVRAAQTIVQGVPRRLDLGRLDRAAGSDYFAVACGAGIDALTRALGPVHSPVTRGRDRRHVTIRRGVDLRRRAIRPRCGPARTRAGRSRPEPNQRPPDSPGCAPRKRFGKRRSAP